MEADLWEAVQKNDVEIIQTFRNRTDMFTRDLPFMQAIISEAIGLANKEMVAAVVDLFAYSNQHAYQVWFARISNRSFTYYIVHCLHVYQVNAVELLKFPNFASLPFTRKKLQLSCDIGPIAIRQLLYWIACDS